METIVCNLLATLPRPPWTKPLNWNLQMTHFGEERIPFQLYVQPSPLPMSSFPQFDKLPAELQLRILSFCSVPTLFHVMHVSSTLRVEATKLFWSDPNTYYLIASNWLLEGGHPSDTYYELPFLAYVENVEVEYLNDANDRICPLLDDDTVDVQHEVVRGFWSTLRRRFPRARRVVINETWGSLFRVLSEPILYSVQSLIKACPPEIDVFAFVSAEENPISANSDSTLPTNKWQRSLYRPTLDGEWRKVILHTKWKTVLMPVKRFYGPVGKLQETVHVRYRSSLQDIAIGPLVVEALDRHHFDEGRLEPFSCPEPGCEAYFEKAGQFTMHAAEAHNPIGPVYFDILPEQLRQKFQKHKSDIESKSEESNRKRERIFRELREGGPEKRRDIEAEWINQLENDAAWGGNSEEVSESKVWKFFSRRMNQPQTLL